MDQMNPQDNPLLKNPDPFEDYRASMQGLSYQNAKAIEFERLCYEIFIISPEGKKLWELLVERHLVPSQVVPSHPQAMQLSIYFEGFREAIRGLMNMAKAHQERVAQGVRT